MIRLIDNTLMAPINFSQSKDSIYRFCELLFVIGVDVIEIPVRVYEIMDAMPSGNYILNVSCEDEVKKYPNFCRYACHQELKSENSVLDIQINDIREIIQLKTWQHRKEIRIIGLDDLLCHSYEKIFHEMKSSLPNTMINFYPEDTYHCAGALALQWLLENGSAVTSSFSGCMNNAATEEIIMSLRLAIRYKPNRNLTVLPELASIYEELSGKTIGKRKAIIGKNIFKVEAGIHVDGLHKNPITYEAYSPHSVGGKSELVIGKHSGSKAIKLKMAQMKLPVPEDDVVEKVLDKVKHICTIHRTSLNDAEFADLMMEVMPGERDKANC